MIVNWSQVKAEMYLVEARLAEVIRRTLMYIALRFHFRIIAYTINLWEMEQVLTVMTSIRMGGVIYVRTLCMNTSNLMRGFTLYAFMTVFLNLVNASL